MIGGPEIGGSGVTTVLPPLVTILVNSVWMLGGVCPGGVKTDPDPVGPVALVVQSYDPKKVIETVPHAALKRN